MRRPQFSIASLMKTVVVVAVCAAALNELTEAWTFVVFSLGLVVLSDATIRSRFGPQRDRAWWFGFSVFEWIHLGIGSTEDAGFLPTYHSLQQTLHGWLPRLGFTETKNRYLIINVILSLIVGFLGGLFTSWYAKQLSPSTRKAASDPNSPFIPSPEGAEEYCPGREPGVGSNVEKHLAPKGRHP